ncbi:NYN domain-containing protein [Aquincola sp. MAHUQ-54]|uniref:NYN domain-containing protein n=1 Tax=Aquincola agrisoli TaxID=3119538 RepID=A0AAW9Q2C2_9BURK
MSIGWFVDGSFLYKTYPGQFDYIKLRLQIEQALSDTIDEAYYFNSDDDPPRATRFNNFLMIPPPAGPGLRVKMYWLSKKKLFWPDRLGGGPVLHPADPSVQYELVSQKAVDVGLAFHMVRSFNKRHWTKLVLCAGDGDFHEPVQNLVEAENVELYLVGSQARTSPDLLPYARGVFEVDKEPWLSAIRR